MFVWNLNPVAFSIGPFAVRWYGLVYALGFLFCYYLLKGAAKHGMIKGLTERLAEDYVLYLMIASILVSRLTYVLVYNPAFYFTHPIEIPAVWHGGLSIHGGLLGAILVTLWFCRKHKIQFYAIMDALVAPLSFVLVFGRLANFANGELYGRVTDVSWCVQFPGVDGCRHPSQLYEALYSGVLCIILASMQMTKRFTQGVLFWSFILLYGVFRFFVTFYREFDPTDPALLGLSLGQLLSLAMALIAAGWFIRRLMRGESLLVRHHETHK